jgi:hypothetical protein
MATLDSKSQQSVSAEVEPTFSALRAVVRPLDYQQFGTGGVQRTLGHYRVAPIVGAQIWAANAILAAFRYADPSSFAVILRLYVIATQVTVVTTAAALAPLVCTRVTGYTAAETTSATSVSLANTNKMRSSMASCNATMQLATAAAGLTGGTRTNDSNPFGAVPIGSSVSTYPASGSSATPLIEAYATFNLLNHPLVLAANEGFLVSWGSIAQAVGTNSVAVGVDWAEVATF